MVVVGVCFIMEKREQTRLVNLALYNIEALAGDEDNVSVQCLEDGSVDCRGMRAKYMVEYVSLRYLK